MYQEHERDLEGKTVTHATVKKLLAAFAVTLLQMFWQKGAAVDQYFEHKYFEHLDK